MYFLLNISLLLIFSCGIKKERKSLNISNSFNLAPGFELGDSIYLPEFEAWIYLIYNSNESHATNYCLISFAHSLDTVIIPTSKVCISCDLNSNFVTACDYNFKDFEKHLNSNISEYAYIKKYENDYKIIFDVYISLYLNYPYNDSIATLIRTHNEIEIEDNNNYFANVENIDILKFNYYHDKFLVYVPIEVGPFSGTSLESLGSICIKHFSDM